MKFGITPREWGDFFQEAYSEIKTAGRYGFDSVWFEEHHEHIEYLPSPVSALMIVSQHTSMKLGTNVLILPTYNPVRLAEDVAMLDCTSHGRVILGVGAGYREKDFRNSGFRMDDRSSFMDEAIPLLRRLLSEENVSHAGRHFTVKDATVQPRPHQNSGPPFWVGGWKKIALRRAARLGDAWFPGPTASINDILSCKDVYVQEMKKLGKKLPKLPIMRDVYVAETTEKAFHESEASFLHTYQTDYSSSEHPLISGLKLSFMEWAKDRFIIGSPSDVIEEIDRYRKNGFSYAVLRMALRKLSPEKVLSSIRLLGAKVIPHLSEKDDDEK